MKYQELIPNIKWNCSPYANTNILILCHPQQIHYFLPGLKDHVWEKFSNVTIWQTKKKITDRERLAEEACGMDGVICFMSELFLSDPNDISDSLLSALIRKNQALLPILTGEELEGAFEKKYGHIQFVKAVGTRTPGLDKIEEFIRNIKATGNDPYPEKDIYSGEAFDCFSHSYFISYRKADGKYVGRIQEKIHGEPALTDTQLWYDSYLPPGENYDENLSKMMDQCEAILLLVTPRLLEPGNYVVRVEVPYARAAGKPVIPVLMEKTDLRALYKVCGISRVYDLDEWGSFSGILADAGLTVPEVYSYPRHLVRLGMAYRDGKYVEQNTDIACELFYQAAACGYPAALEKLIEIKTGEYQEADRNFDEASKLFEQYTGILERDFKRKKDEDSLILLLEQLRKCGEFYLDQGKLTEAHARLARLYDLVKDADRQGMDRLCSHLSVACLLLGKTLDRMGDYEGAEGYFRKSVDLDIALNDDSSTFNSVTYTNCLTSLCEAGSFYQEHGQLLKAKAMFEEVLRTVEDCGTFWASDWDSEVVYSGYSDESEAETTEELSRYALISLMEIEAELSHAGKYQLED